MKYCSNPNCEQQNPQSLTNFYKKCEAGDGLSSNCKSCGKRTRDRWRKNNSEKIREGKENWRLNNLDRVKKNNLRWRRENPERIRGQRLKLKGYWPEFTWEQCSEEFNRMLVKQNGVCEICSQPEVSTFRGKIRDLAVDHNHKTSKVRGLLCQKCNHALGLLKENKKSFQKAIEYLEFYEE